MRLYWLFLSGALVGCERSPDPRDKQAGGMTRDDVAARIDTAGLRFLAVPTEFEQGEALFEANCASCHGDVALGTAHGPPLVHIVYEPSHHADVAFLLATERGVRAHHWGFGDMPRVPDLSREEVRDITDYVRWLQRQAGVY